MNPIASLNHFLLPILAQMTGPAPAATQAATEAPAATPAINVGVFPAPQGNVPRTSPMDGTLWLPSARSSVAPHVDALYAFINAVCYFFFFLIIGMMVFFIIKYRRRPNAGATSAVTHNTPLEITWTAIPLVIVLFMFIFGFNGYVDLDTPPNNAMAISGTGQQWDWNFTYDNGAVSPDLYVPIGQPVLLTMTSPDVIHSFYVPHFRVQRNVIPRRNTLVWFTATEAGVYPIYCTQYCGDGHSKMVRFVHAVPLAEFRMWKDHQADPFMDYTTTPPKPRTWAGAGAGLYQNLGCISCHSVDGSRGTGPSWKNVAGYPVDFDVPPGGHIDKADYAYLKESIVQPDAKIVHSYANVMPGSYANLGDKKLNALIAYINTLSDKSDARTLPPGVKPNDAAPVGNTTAPAQSVGNAGQAAAAGEKMKTADLPGAGAKPANASPSK